MQTVHGLIEKFNSLLIDFEPSTELVKKISAQLERSKSRDSGPECFESASERFGTS